MPRRNIYVPEGREALYDEAAAMAGSLSSAIDAGLELWVAQVRAGWLRVEDLSLPVGRGDDRLVHRFRARDVGEVRLATISTPGRTDGLRVFQSTSGRLAAWHWSDPDWSHEARTRAWGSVDSTAEDWFERWGLALIPVDTLDELATVFDLDAPDRARLAQRLVHTDVVDWEF